MSAPPKKYSLETIGIYTMLGLIGLGFIVMLVVLVQSRFAVAETGTDTKTMPEPVVRSKESIRTYNKPLVVHSYTFSLDPLAEAEKHQQHDNLIPTALPEQKEDSLSTEMYNARRPVPVRKDAADEDDFFGKEKKDTTGWGWLADDVKSSRSRFDEINIQADEPKKENDPMSAVDMPRPPASGFSEQSDRLFRSTSDDVRQTAGQEGSLSDFRTPGDRVRGSAFEVDTSRDRSDDLAQRVEEFNGSETESGLVMRDPFARDADANVQTFGSRDWQFGSSADSVVRSQSAGLFPAEREDERRNSTISSISSRDVDSVSSRLIGDAGSDASRMSVGWTGYSSDSVFNGGGGYTPSGVGSSGSDSLFSGAGLFGGESGGSAISPVGSLGSGIAPIDDSSLGITPSRASGNSSLPSALPW